MKMAVIQQKQELVWLVYLYYHKAMKQVNHSEGRTFYV